MRERVSKVLRTGQAAIAAAVFARESDRVAIEPVALTAGVPFVGLWLETIAWHRVDAAGNPELVAKRALAATALNGRSERTR